MENHNYNSTSQVKEFYSNKKILITGATGFMGKILIEKLLRSCSDIENIYLLVRPKKNKQPNERIQDIINCPVFDKLRDSPIADKLFKKLRCVSGDVTQPNLNLSQNDLNTLQTSINIVFHMAATVRFDQPLKTAITLNTGGTKNLLDVVTTFQNLLIFVHVSTSYCHCNEVRLEEKLYNAPHEPQNMLNLVTWMDDDVLAALTKRIIKSWPNTYAYTKCLTEQLVAEYGAKIPVVITRPSIITASWREPLRGWVDNLNGPTGLLVGAGKGVIRSMHCDAKLEANIVPVDVAINSLILVAYKEATRPHNEVGVYHITSNNSNPITWGEALEAGRKHVYNYPFSVCLWYPGGNIKSNYWYHAIAVFFLHLIPAYIVDFLMLLTGNKTFLVRTQKRIQNGLDVLQYYTTRPWYFHNEKLVKIWEQLSPQDQDVFFTDQIKINFDQYIKNYIKGARRYCVREEPDTLPHARKILKRLYYLDLFKNLCFGLLFLWFFSSYASFFLNKIEETFVFSNSTKLG